MTDRLPPSAWANRSSSRRGFLGGCGVCAAALFGGLGLPSREAAAASRRVGGEVSRGLVVPHLSEWYTAMDDKRVQCTLCPHGCVVPDGGRGRCEVRENREGKYYSMVYGNPCAVNNDPVEKKPFFHVLPATLSFSIATAGCNLDCKFCQNWEISQTTPEQSFNYDLPPEKVVEMALEYGSKSIASTYVEPTIFLEYMLDVGKEARRHGILNVMHSNGFIERAPLEALIPYLDAACIDLKGASEAYYHDMTGGRMAPVLATLKRLEEHGVHTETVTLMVPGRNDSEADLRRMCRWVRDELGEDTPMHFSRFHPMYKLTNLSPTPVETLEMARSIAMEEGIQYAYIGNVPGNDGANTYCPSCKKIVLRRVRYETEIVALENGRCTHCDHAIPGIWTEPHAQ